MHQKLSLPIMVRQWAHANCSLEACMGEKWQRGRRKSSLHWAHTRGSWDEFCLPSVFHWEVKYGLDDFTPEHVVWRTKCSISLLLVIFPCCSIVNQTHCVALFVSFYILLPCFWKKPLVLIMALWLWLSSKHPFVSPCPPNENLGRGTIYSSNQISEASAISWRLSDCHANNLRRWHSLIVMSWL